MNRSKFPLLVARKQAESMSEIFCAVSALWGDSKSCFGLSWFFGYPQPEPLMPPKIQILQDTARQEVQRQI